MITDGATLKLAAGCRLQTRDGQAMLLVPEGALNLLGPGREICELIDGRNTFAEIVSALQGRYTSENAETIRQQTLSFVARLMERGILRVQAGDTKDD